MLKLNGPIEKHFDYQVNNSVMFGSILLSHNRRFESESFENILEMQSLIAIFGSYLMSNIIRLEDPIGI